MTNFRELVVLATTLVALTACAKTEPPAVNAAADQAPVRAVNIAWYKAYNAGDGAAVAALYAEDAVLSVPGVPPMRGGPSIREFYPKDVAKSAAAATVVQGDDSTSDVGMSGDLAWQWETYKVTDKSGAAVDTGKALTVFQRRDGKWMIIRDIWNSDTAPAAQAAAPASAAPPK